MDVLRLKINLMMYVLANSIVIVIKAYEMLSDSDVAI